MATTGGSAPVTVTVGDGNNTIVHSGTVTEAGWDHVFVEASTPPPPTPAIASTYAFVVASPAVLLIS